MPEKYIKSIEIEGFRSIKKARLELGPLNILVGPNQSGKTNLLDALDFLSQLGIGRIRPALRARGGFSEILWAGGRCSEVKFLVEVVGGKWRYQYSITLESTSNDYQIKEESIIRDGSLVCLSIKRGRGFVLLTDDNSLDQVELTDLQEPALLQFRSPKTFLYLEHLRFLWSTVFVYPGFESLPVWSLGNTYLREPQPNEVGNILYLDGSNLINVLHTLQGQDPSRWREFLDFLRGSFPFLKEISFPPDTNNRIGLFWHDSRFPEKPFPIALLSEGTVRVLALAASLFSATPPTCVALEEPEAHLHPELLYRFVGLLEQVSSRRQILLTTHSDALLSYLTDPSVVILASNTKDGSRFVRPAKDDLQEWLKDYSLGQLREAGHLMAFADAQDAA